MTEVQRKYLEWVGYNDFEIQEVETEIKSGEEPLVFEGNQFYAWENGYNKANEWHYVKDELPPSDKDKYYFVVDKLNEPMIARFYEGKWSNYSVIEDAIVWKEIVLPELKEKE